MIALAALQRSLGTPGTVHNGPGHTILISRDPCHCYELQVWRLLHSAERDTCHVTSALTVSFRLTQAHAVGVEEGHAATQQQAGGNDRQRRSQGAFLWPHGWHLLTKHCF